MAKQVNSDLPCPGGLPNLYMVATQKTLVDGHTLRLPSLTLSLVYGALAMQGEIE